MDASATPSQTTLLLLEIDRTPDGRLEGRVRTEVTNPWSPFSGVLELLKVLEQHASISAPSTAHANYEGRDL
jgi:hypothetical protein